MIAGMTYYQICWYFLIYSFLGWCVEVVYHAVTVGKVINRGFLNGPVCPVYGFGSLAVFALGNCISREGTASLSFWPLFILGVLLATLVELIAGWLLDVLFHARWWDYTGKPFSFRGYICLEFSLIWGLGIVFIVRVIHPSMDRLSAESIDPSVGWPVLALLYAVFLADLIVSVAIVQGMNRKLESLDDISRRMRSISDRLSRILAKETIRTANVIQEGQVQAALGRAELRDAAEEKREELEQRFAELQQQREELSASLTGNPLFGSGRLLRAFPGLKHRIHPDLIRKLRGRLYRGTEISSEEDGKKEL